jgi:hypothetical protein
VEVTILSGKVMRQRERSLPMRKDKEMYGCDFCEVKKILFSKNPYKKSIYKN